MKSHEEIDRVFMGKVFITNFKNNLFSVRETKDGIANNIWYGTYAECYGIYMLMQNCYRTGYKYSQLDNSSHEKCNRMDSRATKSKES